MLSYILVGIFAAIIFYFFWKLEKSGKNFIEFYQEPSGKLSLIRKNSDIAFYTAVFLIVYDSFVFAAKQIHPVQLEFVIILIIAAFAPKVIQKWGERGMKDFKA